MEKDCMTSTVGDLYKHINQMKIFAETERLILREIVPEDVEGMYHLDSDIQVHIYLGNNPIKDRNEALNIIDYIRNQYQENGIGRWAMIDKQTNEFIGWTGLKLVRELVNNHIDHYDLGYRLIRKYWGQGYATEGAVASLRYGFEKLQLKEIFAAAHVDNIASNKILQKVGFQKENAFLYDGAIHHWYRCLHAEAD